MPSSVTWRQKLVHGFVGLMAVLTVIGGLLAFAQPAPAWHVAVNVLAALLAAVVIVVLFRPDANAWFAKRG